MGKSRTERTPEDWAEAGRALCRWYEKAHRILPWRLTGDPYAILVSEVMLQQTQTGTVCGRYEDFLHRFPDAASLADASEEELLKAWEGLGYYSRARNLQKAARAVRDQWGGKFPQQKAELLTLPGVGDYTASAVAAIAFGCPETAMDANAERIAARLDCIAQPVRSAEGKKRTAALMTAMRGASAPDVFTQAVMELGQTVCTARNAGCEACPVRSWCRGKDDPYRYPEKRAVRKRPTEQLTALFLADAGRIALEKRPARGLLAGMYGPKMYQTHLDEAQVAQEVMRLGFQPRSIRPLKQWKHEFTHRIWDISAWLAETEDTGNTGGFLWATARMLREDIAVPTAFGPAIHEWERTAWTES